MQELNFNNKKSIQVTLFTTFKHFLVGFWIILAVTLGETPPASAHTGRIAVISAFEPEMSILKGELENANTCSINGVKFTVGTLQKKMLSCFSVELALLMRQ